VKSSTWPQIARVANVRQGPRRLRPQLNFVILLPVLTSLIFFTVPLLSPHPTAAFPEVSNEELAALSLVVYEDVGSRAAFPVDGNGNMHVVEGWVRVQREELAARDLRVDVYRSHTHRAYAIAVRGTVLSQENFRANLHVAMGDIDDNLVEMIRHLDGVVRALVAMSKRKRWRIYLTGHSLGAYLACLAYLEIAADAELRRRITRVVLFESPGVPPGFVTEELWKEVRPRIVEFMGAPNMINMVHPHVGGEVYRVKKYHCLAVNGWHVLKCTLGSAGLVLNLATWSFWTWGKIAQHVHWRGISTDAETWLDNLAEYETLSQSEMDAWESRRYLKWAMLKGRMGCWLKTHGQSFQHQSRPLVEMIDAYYLGANILELTKMLSSFSTFVRASLGLSDELTWTYQQHGMIGFWQSFDPGADLPRNRSYQIVKQWPKGNQCSALNLLKTALRGSVPFHPAVPGLHNVGRPNAMTEARVCTMHGYEFEEPPQESRKRPRWFRILEKFESPLHIRRRLQRAQQKLHRLRVLRRISLRLARVKHASMQLMKRQNFTLDAHLQHLLHA